jgi:hypothetical protein
MSRSQTDSTASSRRLLALEVEVEGALREAALGGDVFDARAHDAVLHELRAGSVAQRPAGVRIGGAGHGGAHF